MAGEQAVEQPVGAGGTDAEPGDGDFGFGRQVGAGEDY